MNKEQTADDLIKQAEEEYKKQCGYKKDGELHTYIYAYDLLKQAISLKESEHKRGIEWRDNKIKFVDGLIKKMSIETDKLKSKLSQMKKGIEGLNPCDCCYTRDARDCGGDCIQKRIESLLTKLKE